MQATTNQKSLGILKSSAFEIPTTTTPSEDIRARVTKVVFSLPTVEDPLVPYSKTATVFFSSSTAAAEDEHILDEEIPHWACSTPPPLGSGSPKKGRGITPASPGISISSTTSYLNNLEAADLNSFEDRNQILLGLDNVLSGAPFGILPETTRTKIENLIQKLKLGIINIETIRPSFTEIVSELRNLS